MPWISKSVPNNEDMSDEHLIVHAVNSAIADLVAAAIEKKAAEDLPEDPSFNVCISCE